MISKPLLGSRQIRKIAASLIHFQRGPPRVPAAEAVVTTAKINAA